MAQMVKNLPEMRETWVGSLGWEDPLEKEMATYSSILAWRISWTEEESRDGSALGLGLGFFSRNTHNKIFEFSCRTMATQSSTLAWKTPWTEEPGRLQSMG